MFLISLLLNGFFVQPFFERNVLPPFLGFWPFFFPIPQNLWSWRRTVNWFFLLCFGLLTIDVTPSCHMDLDFITVSLGWKQRPISPLSHQKRITIFVFWLFPFCPLPCLRKRYFNVLCFHNLCPKNSYVPKLKMSLYPFYDYTFFINIRFFLLSIG